MNAAVKAVYLYASMVMLNKNKTIILLLYKQLSPCGDNNNCDTGTENTARKIN